MSGLTELEQIKENRTRLEDQAGSLEKKQKSMEETVRLLEEKIAVEELKNSNRARSDAIAQLESRVNELEKRLVQVSQAPESKPPQANISEDNEQVESTEVGHESSETVLEEPSEEEVVSVRAFVDSTNVDEKTDTQDTHTASQKKKHKFF